MKRYRIKPYDLVNDIWILQERFLLFFWKSMGAGSKAKVSQLRDKYEFERKPSING